MVCAGILFLGRPPCPHTDHPDAKYDMMYSAPWCDLLTALLSLSQRRCCPTADGGNNSDAKDLSPQDNLQQW
jgi:hypothetical protein